MPFVSVVAESTVPPTFAIAAADAFDRASPVSGVSGVRAGVVVAAVSPIFEWPRAATATAAPASAQTATRAKTLESFLM
jgi:hypothetical protein